MATPMQRVIKDLYNSQHQKNAPPLEQIAQTLLDRLDKEKKTIECKRKRELFERAEHLIRQSRNEENHNERQKPKRNV